MSLRLKKKESSTSLEVEGSSINTTEYLHQLRDHLVSDLRTLGLYDLEPSYLLILRTCSVRFWGRYMIATKRVVLYAFMEKNLKVPVPYAKVLLTAVHEVVHHIQRTNPMFIRVRGVMHDPEFYEIYNGYADKARALLKERGEMI